MHAEDYLSRLNTNHNVWYGGRIVEDISGHPVFGGLIQHIVDYYAQIDIQPDVFAAKSEYGAMSISLAVPKTLNCLHKKRQAYKAVADKSFGMLGRTPDFMNAGMAALFANAQHLGRSDKADFAENAKALYAKCCEKNLFVSHAAINPQIDRSKSLGELGRTFAGVKVTSETSDGIFVSGAKMIVTLGPVADLVMVFNMPGLRKGDDDFAVAFAIPSNAAGIKFLCRNSTIRGEQSAFDRPLANRFDEIDALMLLEDVFVPWENVLIYRDIEKSNFFFDGMKIRHHTGHQGIVRGLSKLEFVGGVAFKVSHLLGLQNFLPVQQKLGEITSHLELTQSIIENVENTATPGLGQALDPNTGPIQALRLQFPRWYKSAIETVQSFCAGSMMSVPSYADFMAENNALLEEAFGSEAITAKERFALLNLAWDLCCSEFGHLPFAFVASHAVS